jgi:hypothetical protein
MSKETVEISGLMLRTLGQYIVVELEINGKWHIVARDYQGPTETSISHIIEPAGILTAIQSGTPDQG